MTIVVSPDRAAALATSGESNNPFVTGAALSYSTVSAAGGTVVQAAANAFTGVTYDHCTITEDSTDGVAITIDYGSAVSPTLCAIAAHNISDVGGVVRFQNSDDASSWTNTDAGVVTPSDNQAIAWRITGESHRYWRVLVTGAGSGNDVSIGVVWVGNEIILPRRLYQGYRPALTPTAVDLRSNQSEGAHLISTAFAERGSSFSASIGNVSPTFFRGATWLDFQRRWNQGRPSFWAWRPTKYGDLHYAWRPAGAAAIAPTNSGPLDLMSVSIEGRLYDV